MSRRRGLFWGPIAVLLALPAVVRAADTPAAPQPIRVAVFDDAGTGLKARTDLLTALAEREDIRVERVRASDIRAGCLVGCDALIVPGGMSTRQGETLGEDGRDRVRAFVRGGGGYVGFCAGAYLATCDYEWSLGIINAKVIDKEHWARGTGPIDLAVSPAGRDLLRLPADRLSIYYHQGPLLAPAADPDLPAYEPLAQFDGEIAKNGAPKGVMKGTTAIAVGRYGRGRVLCFSPHPEMTDGLHALVHRAVEYVAADAGRVEMVGHRGASFDAPENTVPSFKLAYEQGADAAELDVYVSKDGQPVVIHDRTTKRVGGVDKPVAAQTLAELRQLDVGKWKGEKFAGTKLPTLAEALATVPSGKRMFVEIKCGPEGVPAILRVVKESGLKPEQVAIISFSADVVKAAKKERPDLQAYWIVDIHVKGRPRPTPEALVEKAKAVGADGLDLSAGPALDKAFAAKVREAGLRLYVWTVDDPTVARQMVAVGVDGITTNRPGWLREKLK